MTRATQYLLALYITEHRQSPPVSPGTIAEMLDRSPAATTEMLQRLEADGLITHEPYDGATLTRAGRETAAELHETYVTLSWFFRVVLDLEEYEREAMELAGTVSPTVTERLIATLPIEAGPRGQTAETLPGQLSGDSS